MLYQALPEGQGDRRRTSPTLSYASTVLLAACAGVLFGLGLVHATRIDPALELAAVRSTAPMSRDVRGFASRQQQAAIERFQETGLRPGQKFPREPKEQIRTGRSIVADPVELQIKDFEGQVVGSDNLSLKVARPETARGLVHRYLMYAHNSMRAGTASTLTRGDVRGGGKKPYQQKKTGNARQGSRRTPLRPGGGVIFGPKPRDWSTDMNQKERRIAMATALQSASPDFVVVEDLDGKFEAPKTKSMIDFLGRVGTKPSEEKVLLVVEGQKRNALLSARNIDRLKINKPTSLRIVDVLGADKIVMEKSALETMKNIFGPQAVNEAAPVADEGAAPVAAEGA
mmetsp:Transcript_23904/g.57878  ORF Transcript_23904/g.57878 Transcript_23904/m.57878 type:complete len:342 (-) Transcript_23904:350-1375(-)|eukprot:CAMPEP_0114500602 /NCGR_PEP_ID=MMETSP0109-20121206/8051_1 /TAXON_ID=29199 /ORGANISM="Chlorarachnion reptans, Strain CCCM449" /LENGTH=341 /DNA_ID=CAMNT_0001678273 /DNA_START=111 /DNA_END=1136 /DNA_ORIENTATION=-